MRIVYLEELLTLPNGTPFREYDEGVWDTGFEIFAGRTNGGFYFYSVSHPSVSTVELEYPGTTAPLDLTPVRDNYCRATTRYLIWEPEDVQRIINLLEGKDE